MLVISTKLSITYESLEILFFEKTYAKQISQINTYQDLGITLPSLVEKIKHSNNHIATRYICHFKIQYNEQPFAIFLNGVYESSSSILLLFKAIEIDFSYFEQYVERHKSWAQICLYCTFKFQLRLLQLTLNTSVS